MNKLYLVSCVGMKRLSRSLAEDIYVSPWFLKARQFVESQNALWYILSAEYGLLHPSRCIDPYDRTLNSMSAAECREWARMVEVQMENEIPTTITNITILAGKKYRENLMPHLRARFDTVCVPMEGLRFGEQLQWLKMQIPSCE